MSVTKTDEERIVFHCDTGHCKAQIETKGFWHENAAKEARAKGWAIGTYLDACPAHHV